MECVKICGSSFCALCSGKTVLGSCKTGYVGIYLMFSGVTVIFFGITINSVCVMRSGDIAIPS